MSEDAATAMGARRSQSVDRTLKTVEKMLFPVRDYSERFVVFVSTYFTSLHDFDLLTKRSFDDPLGQVFVLIEMTCIRVQPPASC
jgi:hypothetical protein